MLELQVSRLNAPPLRQNNLTIGTSMITSFRNVLSLLSMPHHFSFQEPENPRTPEPTNP